MSPATFLEIAERYGLPGILCFVVLYAYYAKDKALTAETRSRVEDAKIGFAQMAKGQEVLGAIAEKFSDENNVRVLTRELVEAIETTRVVTASLEKRERELEQRERDLLVQQGMSKGARRPGGGQ